MRVPKVVLAAKCSDRWIGLRSPVTSAKPTTSDAETVFDSRSVMPTERSSKNKVRNTSIELHRLARPCGRPQKCDQQHIDQREQRQVADRRIHTVALDQ